MNNQEKIKNLKQKYPSGTRIQLSYMEDEQAVPEGTCGTVKFVDDGGTIHMKWDNGRGLGLIEDKDQFEILETRLSYKDKKMNPYPLKTMLTRSTERMFLNDLTIEQVIELPDQDFQYFKNHLNEDYNFIRNYRNLLSKQKDTIPCLLIKGETSYDVLIIQSDEKNQAEYYSYIPYAQTLLERMHLKIDSTQLFTQAQFHGKDVEMEVCPVKVEKIVQLSDEDFSYFSKHLLNNYAFIDANKEYLFKDEKDVQHCMLVMGEDHDEGILVQSEGAAYARYSALLPNARIWVKEKGLTEMVEDIWDLEKQKEEKIRVLIVDPQQPPRVEVIDNRLSALQKAVGGYIEVIGLSDNADLICNEEGKLNGSKLNRRLGSDIICGSFVIVGTNGSEYFCSLSDEDIQRYQERFKEIEQFSVEEIPDPCMKFIKFN